MYNDYEEITADILNNKENLDEKCWVCESVKEGKDMSNWMEDGVCVHCNGTGFQLTDLGQSIIDLIKRHKNLLDK